MNAQAELIAGGAGGYEESRLLPDQRGAHLLKPVDRGILSVHIIAHVGAGHGVTHGGRRLRYGIAAEVDHSGTPYAPVRRRTQAAAF